MEKKILTEEEQEKIKEVMNHIGFMYRFDAFLVKADSIYGRYYKAGVTDYKGCYQEIMQLLNPESKEWQIESQNLTEGEESAVVEVDEEKRVELQKRLRGAEIGDEVLLGRYEQDNNLENGSEKIEWIVLDKQDGEMLLLSKYCLDVMLYRNIRVHELPTSKNMDWPQSKICGWLNEEFAKEVFDEEERSIMIESTLPIEVTRDSAREDILNYFGYLEKGEAKSRLFLLSLEETENYLSIEERMAKASSYAIEKYIRMDKATTGAWWWLRTKANVTNIMYVDEYGAICEGGIAMNFGGIGVRPAMWVDVG